jgi:hypothetical protein
MNTYMEHWQNATNKENYSTGSKTCPSVPSSTTIPTLDQTQSSAVTGDNLKLEPSHGILFNSYTCTDT